MIQKCIYALCFIIIAASISDKTFAQSTGDTTTSGTTANTAASSEKTTDIMMGTVSAATGAALMVWAAPMKGACCFDQYDWSFYVIGPGLIAAGAYDVAKGLFRDSTIDGTQGNTAITPSTDLTGAGVPPYAATALQNALQTAQNYGVNPQDPSSVASFAGNGAGQDPPASATKIPSAVQAQIDAEKNKIASAFHISAVGTEGGGGGQRSIASTDESGPNLSDLMNGLKKKDNGNNTAGLQKTLNGDPIGVASDNIFRQMTRRYQAKTTEKSFIDLVALAQPSTQVSPHTRAPQSSIKRK